MENDPFKEYLREDEPNKKELGYSWYTAIGLQKVDGLSTSDYLKNVAIKNIDGEISMDKAKDLIDSYYAENTEHKSFEEEADRVSVNIARVLCDKAFILSPAQYLDIHKRLFYNVFSHAGKFRDYNITKKEWVLDGDSVTYGGASLLKEELEYDFNEEKLFDYSKLSKEEFIKHIARFISNLWQIHIFQEGNTRTTAVFLIKYLKKFGYDVTNDIFANNAWYFRNALVRANYTNVDKGIFETTEYLEMFLKNLIFGEHNVLKNRYLHINWNEKVDIEAKKVNAKEEKVDIGDINVTSKMKKNIISLYMGLSNKEYFGRGDVISILNLSKSGASKLIAAILKAKAIIPVQGHGKGKYCFNLKGISHE